MNNIVIFYEKPGCATNAKQKKSLREAGYTLIERNLLKHGMSAEELLAFLRPLPLRAWFNPNAPAIKKGEIDPDTMDESCAVAALMGDPILIRRPLMAFKDQKLCGFESAFIKDLLGQEVSVKIVTECSGSAKTCKDHYSKSVWKV